MNPQVYLAALHKLPGMTQSLLRKGMQLAKGNAEAFWFGLSTYKNALLLQDQALSDMTAAMKKVQLERISDTLLRHGIHIITEVDPDFPFEAEDKDKMENVPFMLYIKGRASVLALESMAVVGSRRITPYGERVLEKVIPHLVQCGFAITSGLAKGVDGIAHQLALAQGGKTLAVVGTGIDQIYPRVHRGLEREIVDAGGCILSEFPLGMQPLRWNFPTRNRIIARLAKATIVIEAGSKSGSIRTAEWASEYGKSVYVVPGSIFSEQSLGCHELLAQRKSTVSILSKLEDILECEYQSVMFLPPKGQMKRGVDIPEELLVLLELIGDTPLSISEIALRTGLSLSACMAAVGQLELYNAVVERESGWVRKGASNLLTI